MVEGYAPDASSRGDFTARILFSIPPQVTLLAPLNHLRLIAPATIPLHATASDPDGAIRSVEFFTDGGSFRRVVTNSPFSAAFTNVTAGFFTIHAKATDNFGVSSTTEGVEIQVSPANDDFADRIAVTGTNLLLRSVNIAATREAGEPLHASLPGHHSIWWTWTAPFSTRVTLSTTPTGVNTLLGVYTGDTVPALRPVSIEGNGRTLVRFTAMAGTAYQIAVDSDATPITTTGSIRVTLAIE